MENLSRSEYPGMLAVLPPGQAVAILQDRVKRVNRVNIEIADWLMERRKAEEVYVTALKKLSRKIPPDDTSDLGIFTSPWDKLTTSIADIAASHQLLAQKIETDVERPLREFTMKNKDVQQINTMSGNLANMAKEVDASHEKLEKLKKKGGKAAASKVAEATSGSEAAMNEWNSQAPFIFEKLQEVDESRLNHLRDVLTQYQTHEVDLVERNKAYTEECLNMLLNVQTPEEIKRFASRMTSGRPKLERITSANNSANHHDDTQSMRSGLSSSGIPARPPSSSEKHGFGGLRRLGTVMRSRRQSTIPYGNPMVAEKRSEDRLGNSRLSRDAPMIASPIISSSNLASSPIREDEEPGRIQSMLPQPPEAVKDVEKPVNGEQEPLANTSKETPVDNSGYSIPTQSDDPIAQAEREAAESGADLNNNQFKVEISKAAIPEEDAGESEKALESVVNNLKALHAPPKRSATNRGRREVRTTIFVPNALSPENTSPEGSHAKPARAAAIAEEHHASDTQSIRSARSMTSLISTTIRHPDLLEPGLNSSIVETVSAWFTAGQVTKMVIIGEMALAYNAIEGSPEQTSKKVRFENFTSLEKVAPNPAFINAVPDSTGEYEVVLASLPRTAVAFKYQVHLEESTLPNQVPIVLNSAWKIEPTQASVIIQYSPNPSITGPLTLTNFVIVLTIEATRATACSSKPVGSFSREKNLIFWKLGDVTLEPGSVSRLLARFTTEDEAKPGSTESRWEISDENASAFGSKLGLSEETPAKKTEADSAVAEVDPFADEGVSAPTTAPTTPALQWQLVKSQRKIVSGKYTAIPADTPSAS